MNISNQEKWTSNGQVEWSYPQVHTGIDDVYVDFYCKHPVTKIKKRFKKRFNRYEPGRKRDAMVEQYVHQTVVNLTNGWNPFALECKELGATAIGTVVSKYSEYITLKVERGLLRERTLSDYLSKLKLFNGWLAKQRNTKFICDITKPVVMNYLDYKLSKCGCSAVGRNNTKTFLSSFFSWCEEQGYMQYNPCHTIKMLPEPEKLREPMTADEMLRIAAWFKEHNDRMFFFMLFAYHSLMRPAELQRMRVKDIDMEHSVIFVPGNQAKNHRTETIVLDDTLKAAIEKRGTMNENPEFFVFGSGLMTCARQCSYNLHRYFWKKMRVALDLPSSIQFYSCKDSGIIDLIEAEGVLAAKDQARHTDLSITSKYAKYSQKHTFEKRKNFQGTI